MDSNSTSRRDFVKKAAYVAPAILTLEAAPAYAKSGSEKPDKKPKDGKEDKGYGKTSLNQSSPTTDAPPTAQLPSA